MKIKTTSIVKRIYKAGLFTMLTLIAFVIRLNNPAQPEKMIEPAHAEVYYPYPDGPGDCPDGPGDCA